MAIGLVGAHRVGKTTLARQVSMETGLPLVLTSTSEVFRKQGLDPAAPMTFAERLWIQDRVLDAAVEAWSAEEGMFITDRTPLDMIAYTLADAVHGVGSAPAEVAALRAYMDRCFAAGNRYFKLYTLVQPGIPVVADASKLTAALNPSYIEHLNSLMHGLMLHGSNSVWSMYLHRKVTGRADRLSCLLQLIDRLYQSEMARNGSAVH